MHIHDNSIAWPRRIWTIAAVDRNAPKLSNWFTHSGKGSKHTYECIKNVAGASKLFQGVRGNHFIEAASFVVETTFGKTQARPEIHRLRGGGRRSLIPCRSWYYTQKILAPLNTKWRLENRPSWNVHPLVYHLDSSTA